MRGKGEDLVEFQGKYNFFFKKNDNKQPTLSPCVVAMGRTIFVGSEFRKHRKQRSGWAVSLKYPSLPGLRSVFSEGPFWVSV